MRFDGIQRAGGPAPGIDPDTYAQQYANEHGITLEEAKAELRAKYGDPQQPGMSMQEGLIQFSGQGTDFNLNLYQMIPQDPERLEQFILDGARQAGCTPEEFAEMMGIEPKRVKSSSAEKSSVSSSQTSAQKTSSNSSDNYSSFDEITSRAKEIYDSNEKYDTTRKERKEIRKQTKEYNKLINSYIKDYIKEHKSDWKSVSDKSERKYAKANVYSDAESYAISKFKEQYPDVDITTVLYNVMEDNTGRTLFSHPNLKPYN